MVARLDELFANRPSEPLDLGRHGSFEAVVLELLKDLAGHRFVWSDVEVPKEIDVVHDGTVFDLGPQVAARTEDHAGFLLDHQGHVRTMTPIGQDANVLQAHQGMEDLSRVSKDEGAFCFLGHTSSLKDLRLIPGDLERDSSPLRSEEPAAGGRPRMVQRVRYEGWRLLVDSAIGCHAHDGLVERRATGRAKKGGISIGENAAV